MPFLERNSGPTLHYCLDDFTDPWRKSETILLQHGFGRSSQFWYSWVPYLSRFYKVVRPDLRGLGRSSTKFDLASGITVDAYIKDLVALLDALGLESVHYCGESFGGILGMIFSALHPSRVRTLSLVSAPVSLNQKHQETFAVGFDSREAALRSMGAEKWAAATNATTRFPGDTDPGLLKWYAAEMGKSDVEVLCALYGLLRTASAADYLSDIQCPVLGLYPTAGSITSREQEDQLAAGISHMKFIHVSTKFHSILTIAPAICAQHVLHFAAQFDGIPCHE
jgi:3-oxoadipate enol-lactonase